MFCGVTGARLITKLRQESYSLSRLVVLLKIFNTKSVFRQKMKARFIMQKSMILNGVIIHGHAFMPAPQLTASTAADNNAHGKGFVLYGTELNVGCGQFSH